jgi:hypothetical protein
VDASDENESEKEELATQAWNRKFGHLAFANRMNFRAQKTKELKQGSEPPKQSLSANHVRACKDLDPEPNLASKSSSCEGIQLDEPPPANEPHPSANDQQRQCDATIAPMQVETAIDRPETVGESLECSEAGALLQRIISVEQMHEDDVMDALAVLGVDTVEAVLGPEGLSLSQADLQALYPEPEMNKEEYEEVDSLLKDTCNGNNFNESVHDMTTSVHDMTTMQLANRKALAKVIADELSSYAAALPNQTTDAFLLCPKAKDIAPGMDKDTCLLNADLTNMSLEPYTRALQPLLTDVHIANFNTPLNYLSGLEPITPPPLLGDTSAMEMDSSPQSPEPVPVPETAETVSKIAAESHTGPSLEVDASSNASSSDLDLGLAIEEEIERMDCAAKAANAAIVAVSQEPQSLEEAVAKALSVEEFTKQASDGEPQCEEKETTEHPTDQSPEHSTEQSPEQSLEEQTEEPTEQSPEEQMEEPTEQSPEEQTEQSPEQCDESTEGFAKPVTNVTVDAAYTEAIDDDTSSNDNSDDSDDSCDSGDSDDSCDSGHLSEPEKTTTHAAEEAVYEEDFVLQVEYQE